MGEVESFLLELKEDQQKVANLLHEFLLIIPDISTKLRYKIPFYYRKSWICYINPLKNHGIELAFTRANELSNTSGILDFKDRKQVAGISLFDPKQIPFQAINEILDEAILLDEHVPYQSKRSKKK